MRFELKTGQKDEEIYGVINGKISGEASQQIQEFYYPKDVEFKDRPKVLHEVTDSNEKYAIIVKTPNMLSQGATYLTGVNDEESYFVHEIPDELKAKTLDEIVKEINREDEGYERIQGDVLVQTIRISEFENLERGIPEKEGWFHKRIDPSSLYPRSFTYKGEEYRSQEYFNTIFQSHEVIIDIGKIFRHHEWAETNKPEVEKYIILGENVTLNHNEHTQKTIKIPKACGLLLQAQVGNNKYTD